MQAGTVRVRGALISAWEADLGAVRLDAFEVERGREALAFIQRVYGLISTLRPEIQKAWGDGGHVHVVDSPEPGGPGPRVSQSRLRLRNHGELVSVELFSYANGASRPNRGAGLDRDVQVVDIEPLVFVNEIYRTVVDFLQVALNIDLMLAGSMWIYEHAAAAQFAATGSWPTVGDAYHHVTRELAVADSFENVVASAGLDGAGEMHLTVEQLQRYLEPQPVLENFMSVVQLAVAADQDDRRVTGDEIAGLLGLEAPAMTRLGKLLEQSPDVAREFQHPADAPSWSFMPSYNVHFFRRVHSIDEFLAVERTLLPPAAAPIPSNEERSIKLVDPSSLPTGIVTFLMTDVVESTLMWLQSRAQMYQAMRRHDQLLASAIEANGGVVLKERGEGDSFFAVFQRATDAVTAAFEAQQAIESEEWPQGMSLAVRMAILTGEADAADRDYRSPAVNRCAKLRRRAIGRQVLVSETTYSIVADILREDIQLISVGKRLLEGHDRHEEIYVLQHADVPLELEVAPDEAFPTLSVLPGVEEQPAG